MHLFLFYVPGSRACLRVRRSSACSTLTTWSTWAAGPGTVRRVTHDTWHVTISWHAVCRYRGVPVAVPQPPVELHHRGGHHRLRPRPLHPWVVRPRSRHIPCDSGYLCLPCRQIKWRSAKLIWSSWIKCNNDKKQFFTQNTIVQVVLNHWTG